jgi:hypothetical protein
VFHSPIVWRARTSLDIRSPVGRFASVTARPVPSSD